MDSSLVLINNLKNKYDASSLRLLAMKLGVSKNVLLNWSSRRSSPSLKQINQIAYHMGVDVSELLKEGNAFSVETPPWKDGVEEIFSINIGRLKLERGITEKYFNNDFTNKINLSYRSFLRYVNGTNTRINLNIIDELSRILDVSSYELLERVR